MLFEAFSFPLRAPCLILCDGIFMWQRDISVYVPGGCTTGSCRTAGTIPVPSPWT